MAQKIKSLPAVRETRDSSLGQDDSLEKEMATHSSILAWKIPWMEEPGRLYIVHGITKSWTQLSDFISGSVSLRESGQGDHHVWSRSPCSIHSVSLSYRYCPHLIDGKCKALYTPHLGSTRARI